MSLFGRYRTVGLLGLRQRIEAERRKRLDTRAATLAASLQRFRQVEQRTQPQVPAPRPALPGLRPSPLSPLLESMRIPRPGLDILGGLRHIPQALTASSAYINPFALLGQGLPENVAPAPRGGIGADIQRFGTRVQDPLTAGILQSSARYNPFALITGERPVDVESLAARPTVKPFQAIAGNVEQQQEAQAFLAEAAPSPLGRLVLSAQTDIFNLLPGVGLTRVKDFYKFWNLGKNATKEAIDAARPAAQRLIAEASSEAGGLPKKPKMLGQGQRVLVNRGVLKGQEATVISAPLTSEEPGYRVFKVATEKGQTARVHENSLDVVSPPKKPPVPAEPGAAISERTPWQMTRSEFEQQATLFHGTGVSEAAAIERQGFTRQPSRFRAKDVQGIFLGPLSMAHAYSIQTGSPIWREPAMFHLIPAEARREGVTLPVILSPDAKIRDVETLTRFSDAAAMTRYAREQGIDVLKRGDEIIAINPDVVKTHRQAVAEALGRGEQVPPEVLRDYPDLIAAPPPRQPPAPSGEPPTGGVPPRPPTGDVPPGGGVPPDDPLLARIQASAIKGERPQETLLRRHEGAISTAGREAQILVDEGNRLLRQAKLGQPFRGTVAPKGTQVEEFDELYRLLHSPSKVQAGELVVPERLRPIYDRLRQLTDWEEAARLDFDPAMATVEDYFYRGWKAPEGMFAPGLPARGPLGRQPGFKMPRVNATYEEMRAAGLEPLSWNPFEQWRNSRMMGVRYREQVQLVADLKKLEITIPHNGGPVPQGWRVPRVGPAFEGKPFAIVDEAGNPRPMFTRRWLVPDTLADRLENVYGVAPQLGTVEVVGRAINVAKVIDALVFLPKRVKLVGSVFQHIDFLNRSHLGAWTGMVNALRHGQPVSAVKHLALWPNSAYKILRATVNPGYRQHLRHMALDTTPIFPDRPGLTMKAISEAGLGLTDVTILPANIDQIAREVAQEMVVAKLIKAIPRAIAGLERVTRQGLFQGVYPAAILTDVRNNIAPIMYRNYPHLTDAQMAGQIAKAASVKYSTIPASMSVVQNRMLRNVLSRTFFSMGESEGLLRQAAGAFRGPQAAFWRDHWLGVFIGLTATANLIHFVSTGQPLPVARYSPISRDRWGPVPFGYNRDFAAPNIPLTGRSATELTLDLAGQLDTAFRILDPAGFIGARESVPVRAAVNQIKGTDFFGAPIDEVGPEGIASRTSQLIFDIFAPIGVGQAGLELARSNINAAEGIIQPGEDRLGARGTLLQATGLNLRAETTPQLLARTRAQVMQEMEIGQRYEDVAAEDPVLKAKIDDEVESRLGPELDLRRETQRLRGQETPEGKFFEESEALRTEFSQEQQTDDDAFEADTMEPDVWIERYKQRARSLFDQREGMRRALEVEFKDKGYKAGTVGAAIESYFSVNVDAHTDKATGETDWDGFFEARRQALGGLNAVDRQGAQEFIHRYDTPTVARFRDASDLRRQLFEKPRYQGLSTEQGETLSDFLDEVRDRRLQLSRERGQGYVDAKPVEADIVELAREKGAPDTFVQWAIAVHRRPEAFRNPDYLSFLMDHEGELAPFFPDLYDSQYIQSALGERERELVPAY